MPQLSLKDLPWQRDGIAILGDKAKLQVPTDYRFLNAIWTQRLLRSMGNTITNKELGMIGPEGLDWFAVFSFELNNEIVGLLPSQMSPDARLTQARNYIDKLAQVRQRNGQLPVRLLGWEIHPRINVTTKVPEWAERLQIGDEEHINYRTYIRGSQGVMAILLVCPPEELQSALQDYRKVITKFNFVPGHRYEEYLQKIRRAQFGLAVIVTTFATFIASKAGFFRFLFLKIRAFVAALLNPIQTISALFGRGRQRD